MLHDAFSHKKIRYHFKAAHGVGGSFSVNSSEVSLLKKVSCTSFGRK